MNTVPLGELITPAGSKAGSDTEHPVFSVTKYAGFVPSTEYFKKQVFSRELDGYKRVRPGDFAYATIHLDEGSIGIAASNGLISPMYTVFRPDTNRINPQYLLRFMKSPVALAQYPRFGKGSVHRRKSISLDALCQLEVPLPSIHEQTRIATILDHADKMRTAKRGIADEASQFGRALFVEMFGDPIRNPREYTPVPLGDVGTLDRGVSKHRPRNDPALLGGPYPLIQTGDVAKSGGFITSYSATYSELGLAQSKLWPAGTLCITIAANIAQTGILSFPACFPDSVVGFTADEPTTLFIRTWFTFLQATLEASAPQSAQRNINLAILRQLPVPLPEAAPLQHFWTTMQRITSLQNDCARSVAKFDELFTSLQSRAFRGEL